MTSSYTPNHAGVREFLNSDMMLFTVVRVAEVIKGIAIAMAPIGTVAEGDEHPGLYVASFKIRHHRYGGATNDRAEAVLYNDAPDAIWVEYGHHGREPYHVLRRAAGSARI